jgi:hypothetical protein
MPPKLRCGEDVRIVGSSGGETWALSDWPIEPAALVGQEGEVIGVSPTSDRSGWLVELSVDAQEVVSGWPRSSGLDLVSVWIPEPLLAGTGRSRRWSELVDWEDEVEVEVTTALDIDEEEQANELEQALTGVVENLVESKEISTTQTVSDEDPTEISVSVYPAGDILSAYELITSVPARSWMRGENACGFPESHWRPPFTERLVFLDPRVDEATVTCKYYGSPNALRHAADD